MTNDQALADLVREGSERSLEGIAWPPGSTTAKGYVFVYARVSNDNNGDSESVATQIKRAIEYAARTFPGHPVKVFTDPDITAADPDVTRDGYQAMLAGIRRGEALHLVARKQNRLTRQPSEWEALMVTLVNAGITETHGYLDGTTSVKGSRLIGRVKAAMDAEYVEQLKADVNEALDEIAASGEPPGVRPFGYRHAVNDKGRRTYDIVPEQADAIRWAAGKVLGGWSLASIAAALDGRGLRGTHGGKITANTVRKAVTMPTVAGKRVHRGEIVGDGNWAPILDEQTWQACVSRLRQPRRVKRSDGGEYPIGAAHIGNPTGRKYVLTSGLAVCGVCDAPLIGTMKQLRNAKGKRSVPYLLCHPSHGGKACVGIMLQPTEQWVMGQLFDELDRPEFTDAVGTDDVAARRDQITARLEGIDAQRRELAVMWSGQKLTSAEWQQARDALDGTEQELRAELDALPATEQIDIDEIKAAYADGDMLVDEQRALLHRFVDRVTITRARPGTNGFDENRVSIEWRVQRP